MLLRTALAHCVASMLMFSLLLQGPQGPNAGALQICVDLCTSTTSFIVRQSSDMLQSIAPGASREKVCPPMHCSWSCIPVAAVTLMFSLCRLRLLSQEHLVLCCLLWLSPCYR